MNKQLLSINMSHTVLNVMPSQHLKLIFVLFDREHVFNDISTVFK